MLLDASQMTAIINALHDKSSLKKVEWYYENQKYVVSIEPKLHFEMMKNDRGEFTAAVADDQEDILGKVSTADNPHIQPAMSGLYQLASDQAANSTFQHIVNLIENSEQVGYVSPTSQSIAVRITTDDIKRVRNLMAGKWNLEYSYGKEKVRIDSEGRYFVNENVQPKFILKVLAYSEKDNRVEIAKDFPDGRRYQTEILTLTAQKMEGFAKHDKHSLIYTCA